MKVKEVANIFGMSVNQLVEISGYSRQGLYDVVEKKCNRNPNRLKSVIDHLRLISMSMYEQDIAEARIQLNNRTKILKQLEEQNIK